MPLRSTVAHDVLVSLLLVPFVPADHLSVVSLGLSASRVNTLVETVAPLLKGGQSRHSDRATHDRLLRLFVATVIVIAVRVLRVEANRFVLLFRGHGKH